MEGEIWGGEELAPDVWRGKERGANVELTFTVTCLRLSYKSNSKNKKTLTYFTI